MPTLWRVPPSRDHHQSEVSYIISAPEYSLCAVSFPLLQLRFLLPVLPLLNIPAASGLVWFWRRRWKSRIGTALCLAAGALVAASLVATGAFLAVSRLNYPGGHAMYLLHTLAQPQGAH